MQFFGFVLFRAPIEHVLDIFFNEPGHGQIEFGIFKVNELFTERPEIETSLDFVDGNVRGFFFGFGPVDFAVAEMSTRGLNPSPGDGARPIRKRGGGDGPCRVHFLEPLVPCDLVACADIDDDTREVAEFKHGLF